jgi:TolA-binding protein
MTKSKDVAEYRRLVQQAQDKFNSANYGQAIAIFNDVGDKFDDSLTEGSHHYWVGLGWFYLKENQLAEQSLTQIRDKYPQNRWVPYAKFYLAKIDQLRGLHNRALDQMRKLMEEFPQQDIGEMAKLEVQKMRDSF